jgi:hypothetical protein
MDVRVDTGSNGILLPESATSRLDLLSITKETAQDFAGNTADYPEAFFHSPRLGGSQPLGLSASILPDGLLGGAILPLSALEGQLVLFLTSEGKCILTDTAPEWEDSKKGGPAAGAPRYLPYWENIAGVFLGLEAGGRYYFAQIDTGSSTTSVTQAFIDANPASFMLSERQGRFAGIHGGAGQPAQFYTVTGPLKLLSIDGAGDVGLALDVAAEPALGTDGQPAAPGDLGSSGSPYLGLPGPAPWPVVMDLGLDVLGGYDFAFDRNQHLLILVEHAAQPAQEAVRGWPSS